MPSSLSHRHTALHFGKCTLALHAHRHSSRIHQPYFSHPECPLVQSAPRPHQQPPPPTLTLPLRGPPCAEGPPPPTHTHTQVLHLSMGPLTQGATYLGVPHTVLRHASDDLTASNPTSDTICSEQRA